MYHVPVPRDLAVPWRHRHAETTLQGLDPSLRLRRSIEEPQFFVLERQCARSSPINVGMRIRSDMHLQARDGYIHVGLVHPSLLDKPWVITYRLRHEGRDLWEGRVFGKDGARTFEEQEQYEATWARETRRRRRRALFRDIAVAHFDLLARRGDAEGGTNRTRISNAGVRA
jgi:hypothetical protein